MSEGAQDWRWARAWHAGRRVLVTGGTSGIGAAVARGFLGAGAHVMVTGIAPAEVEALADDPVLAGAEAHVLDVADGAAVAHLVGGLPGLDVLVACAGVIRRGEEHDPSVFEAVLDVNLTGTMRACAAARPLLAASHGAIVTTASMLSTFGGGLVPAYSASKGGVVQLTRSLAIAYAPDGIRVNAIAPGWIETPLTAALREDAGRRDAILARTPLGRWGRPEDLVGGVLYLAGPAAGFVTGSVLTIDGGYAIM